MTRTFRFNPDWQLRSPLSVAKPFPGTSLHLLVSLLLIRDVHLKVHSAIAVQSDGAHGSLNNAACQSFKGANSGSEGRPGNQYVGRRYYSAHDWSEHVVVLRRSPPPCKEPTARRPTRTSFLILRTRIFSFFNLLAHRWPTSKSAPPFIQARAMFKTTRKVRLSAPVLVDPFEEKNRATTLIHSEFLSKS